MQENDLAHLVEHEIPSAAPKQLLAERFFEKTELRADRRLRDV
jgi:hypothetical protein